MSIATAVDMHERTHGGCDARLGVSCAWLLAADEKMMLAMGTVFIIPSQTQALLPY